MLELKHISYRVSTPEGELDILKDINMSIPDHKMVVFTGPNGGGKTTLAKVIMGLVQPTGGQILWNGEDVTNLSITERAQKASATVFSSRRGLKASPSTTCCCLPQGRKSLARINAAPI